MAEMTVELVAVERRLWSGEASFVFARTTEGEIGVLPGHEPTLAQLEQAGVIRIDTPQEIDVERARAAASRADESTDEGAAAKARAETRLKAAGSAA